MLTTGGLKEGVIHVEVKRGQLFDTGQRNTLATFYFGRDRSLSEI